MANRSKPRNRLGRMVDDYCDTYHVPLYKLAKRAGVSISAFQRLRAGKTSPSLDTLIAFSKASGYGLLEVLSAAADDDSILFNEGFDISAEGRIIGKQFDVATDAQRQIIRAFMLSVIGNNLPEDQ